jgi:hypothetical protein
MLHQGSWGAEPQAFPFLCRRIARVLADYLAKISSFRTPADEGGFGE